MIATTTCAIVDATNTVCQTISNFPLSRNEIITVIVVFLLLIAVRVLDGLFTVTSRKYDV